MSYIDREDAGRRLGERLHSLSDQDVVVVGLPRGGVPVAFEVAAALHAPLDVVVVRKLGAPFQPELGMGAVGEDGALAINDDVVGLTRVSAEELADIVQREQARVEERANVLRGTSQAVPISGRTVVVVDDGIATGATAWAACEVVRARGAAKVIVAVPVGHTDVVQRLRSVADEVVCLEMPAGFFAVGQAYDNFAATSDDEVIELLKRASSSR
jgi:putative phosphoribosyl transferase